MAEPPIDLDCWWSKLYPADEVVREQLVISFAGLAVEQIKTRKRGDGADKTALGKQVNGLSVELVTREWAWDTFTPAGRRCMGADPKEPFGGDPEHLAGWSRVIDVYGNTCLPVAWYLMSYYPKLQATRPKDLPREIGSMKDAARYSAPNTLRYSLISGFDGTVTPLFDTEESTETFLAELAAGAPKHVELHIRDIYLAFANELIRQADRILAGEVRRLRGHPDAPEFAHLLKAWADDLRSGYARSGGAIPTREEAVARADELVGTVDRMIADERRQLNRIELDPEFSAASPSKTYLRLRRLLEFNADVRDSVRADLFEMIARGQDKTAVDAIKMFAKRRSWAIRRRQWQLSRKQSDEPTPAGGCGPQPGGGAGTPEGPPSIGLAEALIKFRADSTFPGGFGHPMPDGGDTAEYTVALELFEHPELELTELCEVRWPQLAERAVADGPAQLERNVTDIVRWVAMKSGWRL